MERRGRSMTKLPTQARVCTTIYFLPGYRSLELRPTGGPLLIAAVSYWVYRGQCFSLDLLTGPWSKGVLALAFTIDHSASACFRPVNLPDTCIPVPPQQVLDPGRGLNLQRRWSLDPA